jgi:phosphoserine phosphatase
VQRVARQLGIPLANVHAVPIFFDERGRYLDLDRRSPLWQNGGKVTVLRALPNSHRPVAFVGDGVTDLETQGHADRFVGFGGVVNRTAVQQRAELFVSEPTLAAVLPHVTTAAEREQLAADPQFAPLLSSRHP